MSFYLPIAEIQINLLLILFFGFLVGFMSGLFGVGGGFLMTPLLIFMGTDENLFWLSEFFFPFLPSYPKD